ncbi:MFS transporter [Streptomyces sp. NPDC051020]|uniref:MFS transporter n=1 Tax=Streptomyces sp. NPDC051020 TaxID=3155409 RepID=UPI00343CF058
MSGLLFLPVTLTQFVGGVLAGPLTARMSAKSLLFLGSVPVVVSLLLLAAFHQQAWQVTLVLAIGGAGCGIGLSALSALVVHAVPAAHTGAVSGMNANIRTIGGAVDAAVVATVLASKTGADGYPSDGSWTTVFLLLAGVAVVGLASCLLIPQGRREKEAEGGHVTTGSTAEATISIASS